MTWRALVHRTGFEYMGGTPEEITPRGSLVVETRLAASQNPQTILAMRLSTPENASLTLKAVPGGGVVLVIAGQSDVYHAAVRLDAEARTDILRVTYSWDTLGNAGRVAIEWPDRQVTKVVHTGAAVPIVARDLHRMGGLMDLSEAHPDLIYAALSDIVEPLGPMPSLAVCTPLATSHGFSTVAELQRGDLLLAADGGAPQMVLGTIERQVPAFGSFAPVRLRAPYFGLRRDILVSPDQRLLIDGSEVEYTFGCERVLVSARHLVNGTAAIWDATGPWAQYGHVILPQHAAISAAGASVESLYVGRLRRNNEMMRASLLGAMDPIFVPEQAKATARVLSPFEAITLAERRVA
ncbi:MAG: Hint domain-containing protein [Marinovum sp.]|nr:Hint domain-containing protein [Marinovum sp.]